MRKLNLFKISKKEILHWILVIMCVALVKGAWHMKSKKEYEKTRMEKIQARKDYQDGWKSFIEGVDTTDKVLMTKLRSEYNSMVRAEEILGLEKYQEQWDSFIEGADATDTEQMKELRNEFNLKAIRQSRLDKSRRNGERTDYYIHER